MADEVETFLKYVLERSKEINGGIPHERRGNCENLLNELLLHVDLLGKTVQFLHVVGNISSLDQQDKVKWKDLENVYSEIEKEFVCLYNNYFTQCTLTCELPLLTVDTKRPGRPAYDIPRGLGRTAWP